MSDIVSGFLQSLGEKEHENTVNAEPVESVGVGGNDFPLPTPEISKMTPPKPNLAQ